MCSQKMDEEQGAAKKLKPNENACYEIYLVPGINYPSFYSVYLNGVEYILDNRWELVRYGYSYIQRLTYRPCEIYYPSFSDIQESKRHLNPIIFSALFTAYVRSPVDYVEFDAIPPTGFNYTEETIEDLVEHYDKCETRQNRDACIKVLFHYMRTTKTRISRVVFTYNELFQIIIWKNCAISRHIYSHLEFGETYIMKLLALARHRKSGDNFFAQMPKDILFGLIFPLIRWSLPFLLPIPHQ